MTPEDLYNKRIWLTPETGPKILAKAAELGFRHKFDIQAIPEGCNINPSGRGIHYLRDLKIKLDNAMMMYLKGEIQYFVWCHGADSHIDDPLGTQLNTKQWLQCTDMFIDMINDITSITKSHVPISIALFGGYQRDFNKTLKLHQQDIDIFIKRLLIQK